MEQLIVKKEFHELIPSISDEEYKLLEESILKEGCREQIITWDGIILDGHTRYEICQKHEIRFGQHDMCFENENEAKIWIIRNQLARRNLPPQERARLVLMLKPAIEEKVKEKEHDRKTTRQHSDKSFDPIDTKEELATLAGVSHDTIHKVEVIEKEAPPEIKEAVRKGEISVRKGYRATRPIVEKKEVRPPNIDHDSEIVYRLKVYWKQATKNDKKKFLTWLRKSKEI